LRFSGDLEGHSAGFVFVFGYQYQQGETATGKNRHSVVVESNQCRFGGCLVAKF
jgi:hypothetical protein